jgi:hypothetical protein
MKTTMVLHDVYLSGIFTRQQSILQKPTSFNCFKIIMLEHLLIKFVLNAREKRYPEEWSWKHFNSQQTLSLNTIFSYGKTYRDWTLQEKSHTTRKRGGFLHIWPFNLFAHFIKWNSTICHTLFLNNRIPLIRRFIHYLYWT